MSAAEGAGGAGGAGVGEGSPMGSLEVAGHRGCAAAKVHGRALILVFCRGVACSGILYWLQETNIAPSPSFVFPVYH